MAFWISLAVLLVGVVAGLVYAILRGLALWRRFKRVNRGFGAEAERISVASAQIQVHLDRAGESSARLAEVAERLRVSRAKLDVQLAAIREARHTMRRLLWFLPGV